MTQSATLRRVVVSGRDGFTLVNPLDRYWTGEGWTWDLTRAVVFPSYLGRDVAAAVAKANKSLEDK